MFIKHNGHYAIYIITHNLLHALFTACTPNTGTECSTADANSECDSATSLCKCMAGYSISGTSNKCAGGSKFDPLYLTKTRIAVVFYHKVIFKYAHFMSTVIFMYVINMCRSKMK